MTHCKNWTLEKVLKFCQENFIGEDEREPFHIAKFIVGRSASMDLDGPQGKEKLVIIIDAIG